MNILVTGATGFIGRHLIQRLLQERHRLRALLLPDEDSSALEAQSVDILRGDVLDYASVEKAVANCQVIYHLAAVTEGRQATSQVLEAVNVQGTANIARAVLHAGASRLVFSSSGAIYGRAMTNRAITEETVPVPDSVYGRSKFLAEQILIGHHRRDGLPVVIPRVTAVLGPGGMRWLNLFQTIADGRFRMIGTGDGHHHVADVSDIVDGLVLCGTVKGIEGRPYILAARESVPLRDLIQTIAISIEATRPIRNRAAWPLRLYAMADRHVYGWAGCRLPLADRIDFYLGDRTFDLSRTCRELGYSPKTSTTEAICHMAKWFNTHGYLQSTCR